MKKRRSKAADYQEDYLLNTATFEPERQGISVYSFCHSLLLPNFNSARKPMPYILAHLVLSGEENYLNEDGDRIVRKPGFFSIVDLNQVHTPRFRRKLRLERYFVLFRVNCFLRGLLDTLFPAGLPHDLAPHPERLKRGFEDIRRVLRKKGEVDDVLLGAMGFRLLCEAAEQFARPDRLPASLESALRYIDNGFVRAQLTRREIAAAAGVSPAALGKMFRTYLHTTVNHYVAGLRLEQAKRLLTQTRFPAAEIAARCGFSQPAYFTRVFRERTGVRPLAYRRNPELGTGYD